MRHFKFLTVLVVLALGLGVSGCVPEVLYYYSGGSQIPLVVSTTRMAICFDDELDRSERDAIVDAHPDLRELDDDPITDRFGLRMLRLRRWLSGREVLDIVFEVAQLEGVKYTTPLMYAGIGSGSELLLTDQFRVSFLLEVTAEEIDAMNEANGVEIVEVKYYDDPDRPPTYTLRVINPQETSAVGVLDIANLYYESPLTRSSLPNFYFLNVLLKATGDVGDVALPTDGPTASASVDVSRSEGADAVDVQLVINSALGLAVEYNCDVNGNGFVNAIDVQCVVNAALGL